MSTTRILVVLFLLLQMPPSIAAQVHEVVHAPDDFQAKVVEVTGVLNLHFEGNTICSGDEEAQCLSVQFEGSWQQQWKQYSHLQNKQVTLRGTFRKEMLSYEAIRRESGKLLVQLGPYWHTIHTIKHVKRVKHGATANK
jgi:hypothetical protein